MTRRRRAISCRWLASAGQPSKAGIVGSEVGQLGRHGGTLGPSGSSSRSASWTACGCWGGRGQPAVVCHTQAPPARLHRLRVAGQAVRGVRRACQAGPGEPGALRRQHLVLRDRMPAMGFARAGSPRNTRLDLQITIGRLGQVSDNRALQVAVIELAATGWSAWPCMGGVFAVGCFHGRSSASCSAEIGASSPQH
jgi:hypothetical protein